MLGNGDGTFREGPYYSTGNIPLDVKGGDFNGDGNMDLACIGIFKRDNVRILLGNGDGTFQHAGDLMQNVSGFGIAAADFNGGTPTDPALSVKPLTMLMAL